MPAKIGCVIAVMATLTGIGGWEFAAAEDPQAKKVVLVELFTSQG